MTLRKKIKLSIVIKMGIRERIGKMGYDEAIEYVLGSPSARGERFQKRDKAELSRAKENLHDWIDWAENAKTRAVKAEKKANYSRHLEIVDLLKKTLPWKLKIHHIVAILGAVHGLKGNALLEYLYPLHAVECGARYEGKQDYRTFEGSTTAIFSALKRGVPEEVEKHLFEKRQILDSNQLSKTLQCKMRDLNTSLHLLAHMRLVKREANNVIGQKNFSAYSHIDHGDLEFPKNHRSPLMQTLLAILKEGGVDVKKSDVFKPVSRALGNLKYNLVRQDKYWDEMERLGLGTVRTEKSRTRKRTVPFQVITLTPKGRRIGERLARDYKSFEELREVFVERRLDHSS